MKLQDYSKPSSIPHVKVIDLKQFHDDGGSFVEITRLLDSNGDTSGNSGNCHHSGLEIHQLNHSKILKGAVKAFHLHKLQWDVWYVMDRAIVGLVDLREYKDGTPKNTMRLAVGASPQLIVIPPGVAHGIAAPYGDVNMVYMVTEYFNPKDEFRLDWDLAGKDFWEIQKG